MGTIIDFEVRRSENSNQPAGQTSSHRNHDGELILFPGVRVEYLAEGVAERAHDAPKVRKRKP